MPGTQPIYPVDYPVDPIAKAVLCRTMYLSRKVLGNSCHAPSHDLDDVRKRADELSALAHSVEHYDHDFWQETVNAVKEANESVQAYAAHLAVASRGVFTEMGMEEPALPTIEDAE